jgi:flagellar hook-basal body complex protein FliE
MRIESLHPDRPLETPTVSAIGPDASAASTAHPFAQLVDAAGAALDTADAAEAAFAHGRGGLQEMVVSRARADIMLSVAATGAQRAAQALNTLLGMQI